jgi:hypothetical protein
MGSAVVNHIETSELFNQPVPVGAIQLPETDTAWEVLHTSR